MADRRTKYKSNTPTPVGDARNAAVRGFITTAPFPYLILDDSGGIVTTNPAFNKMLPCAAGAFDGSPLARIIIPDYRKRFFEVFRDFSSGGNSGELPLSLIRQDGSPLPVRLHRQSDFISETGEKHIIVAVHDCMEEPRIEERVARATNQMERRTEERIRALEEELKEQEQMAVAFRESQERQSLAFWGAHIGWWDYDVTMDHVESSPRIGDILGAYYMDNDLTLDEFIAHIHPDERDAMRAIYDAHLSGSTPIINAEMRLLSDNDTWKWISIRGRVTEFSDSRQPLRIIGVVQDISETKKAEEEYALLFRHSQDMLAVLGQDGFFRQVNPAWERVLGWHAEEMIGRPAIEFTYPDDRERGQEVLETLRSGIVPPLFVQRALCKDGSYRWISCLLVPLPDHKISFGIARDVTEQKEIDAQLHNLNQTLEQRVEERSTALQAALDECRVITDELHKQKTYLSDAMSLGRIAYWEYDSDNAEFIVNDAFYDLLRTDANREGGYRITANALQQRFQVSQEGESFAACMANVPDEDVSILNGFEMPVLFGDGSSGYVMIRIRTEEDDSGNITRIFGIFQDITALKAMKMAAEHQEAMYRSLFETSPSPIFVADARTGRLLDANNHALRFTGLDISQIRDMHFSELHGDSCRELARLMFERMCQSKILESVLLTLRHNNGTYRPVHVVGCVFENGEKSIAIGIMHDVIGQKEQIEQLLNGNGVSGTA